MGYAFDSTSNFNATWSNSYATAVLAPGPAVAAGFARAASKRYFEFVVDSNANGGYLWLGVLFRLGTMQNGWLLGGGSEVGTTTSGAIGGKSPGLTSVTATAGSVFGFAVNYSGDGIGGLSSLTYAGSGIIEVSKNGAFTGHRIIFPISSLYVGGARPLVIQESGTSTSANVTLRVDSLSYSYLPAGYSEWGQSGGTTVTGPAPFLWEYTTTSKAAQWSITSTASSSGNVVAWNSTSLTSSTKCVTVRTNALPLTYKVQFEVYGDYTVSYGNQTIGIIAEGRTTISSSIENPAYGTFTYSGRLLNMKFSSWAPRVEGVSDSGGISKSTGSIAPNRDKFIGFFYDPTRGVVGTYNNAAYPETSASAGTALASPDNVRAMYSLTSSTSIYVFVHYPFVGTLAPQDQRIKLNDGRRRLAFPLLPGWYSANIQRYVSPGGCEWDRPASMTTTVQNGVQYLLNATVNSAKAIRALTGHSSGKKYYEILCNHGNLVLGHQAYYGLTANASLTFVHATNAGLIANIKAGAIIANGPDVYLVKNGASITSSGASMWIDATLHSDAGWRLCVAVDFDAGLVWMGHGESSVSRTFYGGNPALGTGGLTFTAGTTLYPMVGAASNGALNLIGAAAFQDDAQYFGPPSGFSAWDAGSPETVTTTATVTPSFTGSSSATSTASSTSTGAPGGSGRAKWPFGVRP